MNIRNLIDKLADTHILTKGRISLYNKKYK